MPETMCEAYRRDGLSDYKEDVSQEVFELLWDKISSEDVAHRKIIGEDYLKQIINTLMRISPGVYLDKGLVNVTRSSINSFLFISRMMDSDLAHAVSFARGFNGLVSSSLTERRYFDMIQSFYRANPIKQIDACLANSFYGFHHPSWTTQIPIIDYLLMLRYSIWIEPGIGRRGYIFFLPPFKMRQRTIHAEGESGPNPWLNVSIREFKSWRRFLREKLSELLIEDIVGRVVGGGFDIYFFLGGVRDLLKDPGIKRLPVKRKLVFE